MEDKSRIEIIEEGVLQCSEPNFCAVSYTHLTLPTILRV